MSGTGVSLKDKEINIFLVAHLHPHPYFDRIEPA